MEHAESKL